MLTLEQAREIRPRLFKRLSIGGWDACWEWKGAKSRGHGQVGYRYKLLQVHRVAYTLWREPIPDGLTIDHLCRNRACANPRHLEVVPMRENVLRGAGPTAGNAYKTHCIRGHEFTPENTYQRPGTHYRECRICKKAFHSLGRGHGPKRGERF